MPVVVMSLIAAAATAVAPSLAEFAKKKLAEDKESLADLHEVLEKGLKELLVLQSEKDGEVRSNQEQKDPSEIYKLWKTRLSDIEKTMTYLDEEYKQVKKKKWSHRERRAHVKKEIKRALNEVIDLLGKYQDMNVLVDKLPERVKKEHDVPSIAEYPTLQNAFQNILTRLKSDGVKCVALYGQKGVGKTTIMQHLNNHHFNDSSDNKEFGMVIFIKVAAAEQTDERNECFPILQKIAERMREKTKGNELELAQRIQGGLKNKRYLLILDGIRYAFTIDRIWGKLDISSNQNDSKVVVATHYPRLTSLDKVNGIVNLEMLSPQEAWEMFQNNAGNNLPPNAQLICDKFCCRLPLLIGPIAKSFKYREAPIDWENWSHWPESGVDETEELFSILNICYEQLPNQSEQKCFLYAALYPANSKIYTDYFVECCIVQGFLGHVNPATNYGRLHNRGINTILKHLVNVAFLVEGEQMRYVEMNDFYRQLALHISSNDPNPECKIYIDNEQDEEPFRSTSWERARWVSMIDSKRDNLPANPNLRSLQTLFLQKSMMLVKIPPTYFRSMARLLVLNLNGINITKLPSLIGLTSLKVFYLNGCSELIMPSHDEIQRLENLEVFDSRGTQVNFVPCLEHLRCLRISYSPSAYYNEISRLHNLKELMIEVETKFQLQWDNVAQHIKEKAALRNINFFCYPV